MMPHFSSFLKTILLKVTRFSMIGHHRKLQGFTANGNSAILSLSPPPQLTHSRMRTHTHLWHCTVKDLKKKVPSIKFS